IQGPDHVMTRVTTFDGSGNPTQISIAGRVTDVQYDSLNQVKQVDHPARTLDGASFRATETFTYKGGGPALTSTIQSRPGQTQGSRTVFDANWRALEQHDHDGSPIAYTTGGTPSFYTSATYDHTGLMQTVTGRRWDAPGAGGVGGTETNPPQTAKATL